MKRAFLLAALAVFSCHLAGPAWADQAPFPKDDAALQQAYDALHWQRGAPSYTLEESHSRIDPPSNFGILLGDDAERYAFLANGIEFPATQAVVYDPASEADIIVEYFAEGFVKDDDWSDVDPDDFLKQMTEDQHKSNPQRVANGQEAFEVVGWIEPPSYDPATHVARYIVEAGTEQRHWLNAVAVKLSRDGYHQFTWAGGMDEFKAGGTQALETVLAAHASEDGHRYADYKEGDKVAAYGIAGLVAAVAGVKLGKGLLAGALAFLAIAGKKLAILIVPALIGIRAAVKRFFRRS